MTVKFITAIHLCKCLVHLAIDNRYKCTKRLNYRDKVKVFVKSKRAYALLPDLFANFSRTFNGLTVRFRLSRLRRMLMLRTQATRGALHPRTMRVSASLRGSAAWHCRH